MTIHILGGGPAGLAAGFYARGHGLRFRIFEAGAEVGGNCRTLRWGDLRFDTGAHRLHDRDPDVTAELRQLLGADLLEVHAPSQIRWQNRWVDFPLSPLNLLRTLDARTLIRIGAEVLRLRLRPAGAPSNFRELAVGSYGETLAEMFLLGYSSKLWGEAADRLDPTVAGRRLRGLDLRTLFVEALGGRRRKTTHLDGSFLYPKQGIGQVFERVAEVCGAENISCHTRITGLVHERGRIQRIVLNDTAAVEAGTVISTLPLPILLRMLRPRPPAELLELAMGMRFRHLVLGVFRIERPRLTRNASIYFPGGEPYTRLYECKNRSAQMAPPGATAVVLEIPCETGDAHWTMDDARLGCELRDSLRDHGLLRGDETPAFRSFRVPFAYPVLDVGFAARSERIREYLARFPNLHLLGRSARFEYQHIHDIFGQARETVGRLAMRENSRALARTA